MTARIGALVLSLFAVMAGPMAAQPEGDSEPVAIIGSSVITEAEVARIAAGRPEAFSNLPPDERRARIRDTLIAEHLIDYHYGRNTGLLSRPVLDALDDARRQVLFQFFARSRFTPPEITDDDIAAFAEANPALFEDRRSFRYARFGISGDGSGTPAAIRDRVASALAAPAPDLAALEALAAEARGAGLAVTLDTGWAPSEALPSALRDRLDRMARDDTPLDVREDGGTTSLVRLYAAQPLPAQPAALRDQIEQRLVARAYQAHRSALIEELAGKLMAPDDATDAQPERDDAPVTAGTGAEQITPPPRGTVVWTAEPALPREARLAAVFVAALSGTLAGYAAITWAGRVRAQYPLVSRYSPFVPALQRRMTATVLAGLILFALLVGLMGALPTAFRTLGDGTSLVLLAAGIVMAASMAIAWRARSRRVFAAAIEEARNTYSDRQEADDMALLNFGARAELAAAVGLLVPFAIALALVLDVPPGLQ